MARLQRCRNGFENEVNFCSSKLLLFFSFKFYYSARFARENYYYLARFARENTTICTRFAGAQKTTMSEDPGIRHRCVAIPLFILYFYILTNATFEYQAYHLVRYILLIKLIEKNVTGRLSSPRKTIFFCKCYKNLSKKPFHRS